MKKLVVVTAVVLAVALSACGRAPATSTQAAAAATVPAAGPAEAVTALVALAPTRNNNVSGTLTLVAEEGQVSISGQVGGLTPGSQHGFHVHEKGNCKAPDASSAGGHFNPASMEHGDPRMEMHHLGDMLNIEADEKGTAQVHIMLVGVTLKDGGPNDLKGKSIVVHADPDDYATQPAGNSGDRVACGVIF
ncbi:MAG: superoxide dismutase family protein [Pseudomonadota bacterium]